MAFLGGTCNDSSWRDELIPMIDKNVECFNPVVKDWTPAHQAAEIKARGECDFAIYVITPLMTGVYSIAEVVDDSNKRPDKTIFCVLRYDTSRDKNTFGFPQPIAFNDAQLRSLNMVSQMVTKNGGRVVDNLRELAEFVNETAKNQNSNS